MTLNRLLPVAKVPTAQQQDDHRHHRRARRPQDEGRAADHDDAERDHDDVGDDEDDVERVHARGALGEQRRAGIEALHVEHADGDRRDGVARDAEQERRHPARGEAGVVAGAGLDQALGMAGAELLRLLREALRHRVADPGRHVGAGARQHADDDADDVAARLLLRILLGQLPLALRGSSRSGAAAAAAAPASPSPA